MDAAKVLSFLYDLRTAVDEGNASLPDPVYEQMEALIKEGEAK